MQNDTLAKIKEIILNAAENHGIEIDRIILFGSRAKGDYKEESDWDILVVTKEKIEKDMFWKFYSEIKRKLAKIKIYGDLIILSKKYYENYKEDVGNISYYATVEGKVL